MTEQTKPSIESMCEHQPKLCECSEWAGMIGPFLTDHHGNCPKYNPLGDAAKVIRDLLQAMRSWGGEEDGIPDFAADAYNRAALRVGEKQIPEDKA